MSNSTLTITRKSGFNAAFRDVAILVDDEKVGVVGNGKSLEVAIAPGRHAIRARMDWIKSKPLEITVPSGGGSTVELTLCNPMLALFATLGITPYMKLRAL